MEARADMNIREMVEQCYDFGIYLLERNPFIKLLAISGSLTNEHAEKHEDNDFFIVSKENRIWECFAACILYGFLYAKKNNKPRKFFCFNYLIDEKHIDEEIKIDKMSAKELLNLKIIYGYDLYKKILKDKQEIAVFYPAEYKKRVGGGGEDMIIRSSGSRFFVIVKPFFKLMAKIFEHRRKTRYRTGKIYSNGYVIRSHLH